MHEVVSKTYRETHTPASDLVQFIQSIHDQKRVGTLTVSFGTGGVPIGQLVWRESIVIRPVIDSPSGLTVLQSTPVTRTA